MILGLIYFVSRDFFINFPSSSINFWISERASLKLVPSSNNCTVGSLKSLLLSNLSNSFNLFSYSTNSSMLKFVTLLSVLLNSLILAWYSLSVFLYSFTYLLYDELIGALLFGITIVIQTLLNSLLISYYSKMYRKKWKDIL